MTPDLPAAGGSPDLHQRVLHASEDAVALTQLAALPGPFLPWSDFAMRPAAIVGLLTEVLLGRRRRIVELGSGNSTIYLGRLIAQHGLAAHVTSVDHDAGWAQATREAVAREGLEAFVAVVHAPLAAADPAGTAWYDPAALPAAAGIDLLVVDGPPAWQPGFELARRPALDHFAPLLDPAGAVVLDDAQRPGERDVVAAWERAHRSEFRPGPGGTAVASPWTPRR